MSWTASALSSGAGRIDQSRVRGRYETGYATTSYREARYGCRSSSTPPDIRSPSCARPQSRSRSRVLRGKPSIDLLDMLQEAATDPDQAARIVDHVVKVAIAPYHSRSSGVTAC
jgi:hypothetical protein